MDDAGMHYGMDDAKWHATQKYIEMAHSTIRALPAAFDAKAIFFASAVAAALLYQANCFTRSFFDVAAMQQAPWPHVLVYAYVVVSMISLASAFGVIMARTRGDRSSLFSFVSFASRPSERQVITDIKAYTPERMTEAALRHCYELSRLCAGKALFLRLATVTALIAFILFACIYLGGLWNLLGDGWVGQVNSPS